MGSSENEHLFPNVWRGTYSLTVSLSGYLTYIGTLAIADTDVEGSKTVTLGRPYELIKADFVTSIPPTWTNIAVNEDQPLNKWMLLLDQGFQAAVSQSYDFYNMFPYGNNGVLNPDNWLITEAVTIPAISANSPYATLRYYRTSANSDWPDTYSVKVTTDTEPTNLSEWDDILTETPAAGWAQKIIDLSDYAGETISIAFVHQDVDNIFIAVDNIIIAYAALEPYTGEVDDAVPTLTTNLKSNYPNPFNPSTTIAFDIAKPGNVKIEVFNIKGQKVKTIANELFEKGSHKVVWNGLDNNSSQVSSGIYFYRMTTDGYSSTKKMIMIK
jgi:hypothetical protein